MATFPLKVMTIDHCFFEGDVDRIVVRTSQGDVGILPNHVPYIAALGIGALTIIQNGEKRIAAIAGGFVDVTKEGTTILARTCEWADEIDVNRANSAAERARAAIQKKESEREYEVAQVKLKKALNRIRIATSKHEKSPLGAISGDFYICRKTSGFAARCTKSEVHAPRFCEIASRFLF